MEFEKPYMSISELVKMDLGITRDALKGYAHITDCPAIRTPGRGKILFYMPEFIPWLKKFTRRERECIRKHY